MAEKSEQRVCIKFCQKLGDTCAATYEKIQRAFGDEAMSRARVYEWYKRFRDGRTSVDSEERSGRPSTSTNEVMVNTVRAVIRDDRRLTVREVAEDLNLSYGSVQTILTENLGMRRVSAKFVPRLLTDEQKHDRLSKATELLECARGDPNFMKTIITGDESWVYGYDPETKTQSSQWKTATSPRPKKARQVRSSVKVMLTVFFDHKGVVHHEYAPQGQTITKQYYVQVLTRLRDAVRRKRPDLWASSAWQLHHDNAPAHSSHLVQAFLAKHGVVQVPQPPYSPDMAPCDFFLFPKMKTALKGKRFQSREEIKVNATRELKSISQAAFQKCYEQWVGRWEKCVGAQGCYFEGD